MPVSQQRVLEGIESALEGGEPRLRSMFAIFTRLNRDEGVPCIEALRTETLLRRVWPAGGVTVPIRALIAIPLILGLLALCIFMAINTSAGHGCRPVSVLSPVTTCQSAQLPSGRT